ncbi:MAG: DNA-methyltransferase [Armatimonadota bacterium]
MDRSALSQLTPRFIRHVPEQVYDLSRSWVVQGDCCRVLSDLPDRSVDLIFADPPYFLQLQNELRRPNNTVVDAVDDAWDQFADWAEYDRFCREWLTQCQRVLKDTGTLWVIGSYHNIFRIGTLMQDLGYWMLNSVIWEKTNPTPHFRGVRFCNAHEEMIWAAKGERYARGYTFNYHDLKQANGGKQMRSVWRFPICNGDARKKGGDGKKLHSTEKPLPLLQRIVSACTRPGDLVLDPFGGTGTTAEAAMRLGRRYFLIEQQSLYLEYGALPRLYHAEMQMAVESARQSAPVSAPRRGVLRHRAAR